MLERNKEQEEVKKKSQDELAEIKSKLQQITDGLTVANDIVKEGNDELKECLSHKTSTRKELQRAQSKIETGTKRRQELKADQKGLNKRMRELEVGQLLTICVILFL